MARCVKCSAELQPAWKFCIFCGTAVGRTDAAAAAPRIRITAIGLFGLALGGVLAVIAVAAVVVFTL